MGNKTRYYLLCTYTHTRASTTDAITLDNITSTRHKESPCVHIFEEDLAGFRSSAVHSRVRGTVTWKRLRQRLHVHGMCMACAFTHRDRGITPQSPPTPSGSLTTALCNGTHVSTLVVPAVSSRLP